MLHAAVLLALLAVAAPFGTAEQAQPRIASPDVLAIEMAKALVAGDRARFTALAATREEMEAMLEAAQPPSRPEDRQEMNDMFLFERGWAFTSVSPAIGKETPVK